MKTYAYAYECMRACNQNDWNRIWVYAARIVCYKKHITPAQPLISSKLLHNTIVMIQWKNSTTHIRTLFHCGCSIQVYTRLRLLYISFCICLLLFVCGVSFFHSIQFSSDNQLNRQVVSSNVIVQKCAWISNNKKSYINVDLKVNRF